MIAENESTGNEPEDVKLLNAKALAGCLSVSVRQTHRMNRARLIPAPLKIGGCTRWRLTEISDWLAAGSPCREQWKTLQQAKTEA